MVFAQAAATIEDSAPTPDEFASTPTARSTVDLSGGDGLANDTANDRPAAEPPAEPANARAQPAPSASAADAVPTAPCPSCGRPVPVGFLFCGGCGARAASAPATGAAAAAAPVVARTVFMAGAAPAPGGQARGKLVLIRSDGSDGGLHPLVDGTNLVGRGQGPLLDPDAFLSPRHAEIVISGSGAVVRDLHSLNGVFVRLLQEEEIGPGAIFRLGQELLRFDAIPPPQPLEDGTEIMGSPNPGFWGRLTVIVGRDVDGSAFPLFGDGVVLGRERGDILFPEDGYVSGTHARLSYRDGRFYLSDLGSSNGTFLRIRGERPVRAGTFLLMGQQLFKLGF
jgi:hypothetical protein